MKETAQRVALSTLIVIAMVAVALAPWKLKLVLALFFLAFILAAALRPGIERLARAGIPVVVRDVDPAEEDVPTVLFPAKDAET